MRETWRTSDVLVTGSPAPSLLFTDRADYYLVQIGPKSLDGASVLTGSALIDTPEELTSLLDKESTVWIVLERATWERHFDGAFREFIGRNTRLVFEQQGMLVFASS